VALRRPIGCAVLLKGCSHASPSLARIRLTPILSNWPLMKA